MIEMMICVITNQCVPFSCCRLWKMYLAQVVNIELFIIPGLESK